MELAFASRYWKEIQATPRFKQDAIDIARGKYPEAGERLAALMSLESIRSMDQ